MSCDCGFLLRRCRTKTCGVSFCGDSLCHFIDASEGDVDGENICDGDFLQVGSNSVRCNGNNDVVTTEIGKFHDLGFGDGMNDCRNAEVFDVKKFTCVEKCFNGRMDEKTLSFLVEWWMSWMTLQVQ